jgi:hypothetical protein
MSRRFDSIPIDGARSSLSGGWSRDGRAASGGVVSSGYLVKRRLTPRDVLR